MDIILTRIGIFGIAGTKGEKNKANPNTERFHKNVF
jgi:hypothetical protein